MPEPKTMLEATAEVNNLNAVATVKDYYVNGMKTISFMARFFTFGRTHPSEKLISPSYLNPVYWLRF